MEKVKKVISRERKLKGLRLEQREPATRQAPILEKREVARGVPTFHPTMGQNIPSDNPQFLGQGQFYHLNVRKNIQENQLLDTDIEREGIERESTYNALYELGQSRPPQPSQIDNMPYDPFRMGGGSVPSANWLRGNGYSLNNRFDSGGASYERPALKKWQNGYIQKSNIVGNFIGSAKTDLMPLDPSQRANLEKNKESIEKTRSRRKVEAEEFIDDVKSTTHASGHANNGLPQPIQSVVLGVSIGGYQADRYIPKQVVNNDDLRRERIDTNPIFSH